MSKLAAVALLTATFSGCGVTSPAELLDTRLFVSDSIVQPSEPIDVRVEATNRSSRNVRVDSHACPRVFRVVDASGQTVGPPVTLCALTFQEPTTLPPGASFGFTYRWAGEDLNHVPLPEGEYRLRGWISHVRLGRVYSDEVSVGIK